VNFALVSRNASAVELCLFESAQAERESSRVPLRERTGAVWHVHVPGLRPGQVYAYRVDGPGRPGDGHRFDPSRRLLDPQARAVERAGAEEWRGVVVDPSFPWDDDRPPRTPWGRTVIYECHVKGLTARHPLVPERLRGTYLGLASEPVIEHLLSLGVTAVELMPVLQHAPEERLRRSGRTNYWGYSPLGFFAPQRDYAVDGGGRQVGEFQSMVKTLHRHGLEVILDVCYGHTVEGAGGPPLSWAGIDNAIHYRLQAQDRSRCVDWTGCGNTLDLSEPRVLQLVLDSLRHWVREMHVDGFRFDQAVVLGRGRRDFDPIGSFLATVGQDPALAGVKLIAEPWDLGPEGYRLGGFPAGWSEWNDRFRDTVRSFWRGSEGLLGPLASRLAGSSDVFAASRRHPRASINYVACHDGLTLRDVVSFERKHNEPNAEGGRDGHDDDRSRNWGAEGESRSRLVDRRRERAERALMATLAFAQGVPMIGHGDEMGRTQRGNNNAYCLDDETTWVDWSPDERGRRLLAFTRRAFALRQAHPVLRRHGFFHGAPVGDGDTTDLAWLRPEGGEMRRQDWEDATRRVLGMLIDGEAADWVDEDGRPVRGETLLLIVNGSERRCRFALPRPPRGRRWAPRLCSGRRPCRVGRGPVAHVPPVAVALLEQERRR
jgi:glycogen operon protein